MLTQEYRQEVLLRDAKAVADAQVVCCTTLDYVKGLVVTGVTKWMGEGTGKWTGVALCPVRLSG